MLERRTALFLRDLYIVFASRVHCVGVPAQRLRFLNRTLHDAIERRQPISATGMFLKFFYATQVKTVPPTFLLFVNRDEVFSPQYRKYLADQLRQAFGYEGCPIHLLPKPRPKSVESVRTARPKGSGPRRPKPGSGMKERRHGRNRTGKPRKS